MTPTLIYHVTASLDGYIARPDGRLDWFDTPRQPDEEYSFQYFYAGIDALLMGRGTYEALLKRGGPWPYPGKPCVVLTRLELPRAGDEVQLTHCTPAQAVGALREAGFQRIWLVGGSLLGWVEPTQTLKLMGGLGIMLLLFEVGLKSDVHSFLKAGWAAAAVATIGIVTPFVLGYALALLLDLSQLQAMFIGATLTATSVGFSARVLHDLGKLSTPEGNIILGAAVIDDILGLVILSVIMGLVEAGRVSWLDVARTAVLAFLFLGAAVLIGIQFWYADKGGLYILWYLPLLLLLVFRPNLSERVPPPIQTETDWLHRLGRRAVRAPVLGRCGHADADLAALVSAVADPPS